MVVCEDIEVWVSVYSAIKLFSFSSTLVERFSGLAGGFIFNYFSLHWTDGRLLKDREVMQFDKQLIGLHRCVRRCLVRNVNTTLCSLLGSSQSNEADVGWQPDRRRAEAGDLG